MVHAALALIALMGLGSLILIDWSYMTKKTSHSQQREFALMKALDTALRVYALEYGSFAKLAPLWKDDLHGIPSEGAILQALLGQSEELNPKKFIFIELPPPSFSRRPRTVERPDGTVQLLDSWGHPYQMLIHLYGDHQIPDPENPQKILSASVLVYSAGPDGDPDTWQDNLCSWK